MMNSAIIHQLPIQCDLIHLKHPYYSKMSKCLSHHPALMTETLLLVLIFEIKYYTVDITIKL